MEMEGLIFRETGSTSVDRQCFCRAFLWRGREKKVQTRAAMTLEAISLRLLVPDLVLQVTLPSAGRLSMASHAFDSNFYLISESSS